MGFSGGGAGVLTNHTHDTAVTNDGGALAANATMFGLTNQSMLVSDGTNIQELSLGSEADILTSTGGAVSWETPSGGGGTWEILDSTKLTSTGASVDVTFTAKEYLLFQFNIICSSAGNCSLRYTFNSDTGAVYDYNYSENGNSASKVTNDTVINPAGVDFTASDVGFLNVWVHNVADQVKVGLSHFQSLVSTMNSTTGSFMWEDSSNAMTSAQFKTESNSYDTGSEVVVLGYDPS